MRANYRFLPKKAICIDLTAKLVKF